MAAGLVLARVPAAEEPAAGARQPIHDVVLLDQHGAGDSLGAHRGQPVIVLVVQARSLRRLKGWETEVREVLEDPEAVRFLRVADVRPGRGTTRERVLSKLEGRVPPEVSILIDLGGEWREAFGLDTGQPNVLLFDVEGRLVHRFQGPVTPRVAAQVATRLAELGEGSAGGPP